MSNNTKLSIIVPVYNTEDYLIECLDTIVNLEIENYEIIIVDDGSTDSSKEIILDYCNKYDYITYSYQENAGQGSARNVGVNKANGEYIYFMDSDDKIDSSLFVENFNHLYEFKLDAIFFDGKSFYDSTNDEKFKEDFNVDYERKNTYGYYQSGEKLYIELRKNNEFYVQPCLYIVRRDIYVENNLFFPESMKYEDEVLSTKLFFYIEDCYHTNQNVFIRRIRPNSTMTAKINYNLKFLDYSRVFVYLLEFYQQFNFKNETAKTALLTKIQNIYLSCLEFYHSSTSKGIEKLYSELTEVGKQYNYFNTVGKLATKNFGFYKIFKKSYSLYKSDFKSNKRKYININSI